MRYKIFCINAMILIGAAAYCQTQEYSTNVKRSFPATEDVTLSISNKYGIVSLGTWDKDSVSISIDMVIKAKDSQKLEKLKNSIDFNFSSGQYFIVAGTVIGDGGNDIIQDLIDIAGNYFSSQNSVTINYIVMVPQYLTVKIENRFGNVFAGNLSGNLSLNLSYGDFRANDLTGKSDITISSGNAEINRINDGQLSVSFSALKINDIQKAFLETRSSTVNIEKATEIRTDSRRDKFFIGEASSVSGEGYFTDFNIRDIYGSTNLKLRYGSFTAENIKHGFSMVNLSSDFADMNLAFAGPPDFEFNLTQSPDVTFVYPKNYAKLESSVINKEENTTAYSGTFGQGNTNSRVVIIANRKCELTISYR